jgi:hypothetical protein
VSAFVDGVIGAAVGGVVAGGFSLAQSALASKERSRTRLEQNLFSALQYFGGGTQERSIGISIVEGYRNQMHQLLPMFVPLLANQALYLLTNPKAKAGERADEESNLRRIMNLLGEAKAESRGAYRDRYKELADVLKDESGTSRIASAGLVLTSEDRAHYLCCVGLDAGE